MAKKYYITERMVAARPRSERLRRLGGGVSSGSSSAVHISGHGGSGGSDGKEQEIPRVGDLRDVGLGVKNLNDVLMWDGTQWTNVNFTGDIDALEERMDDAELALIALDGHKHDWGDLVNKPNLVEGIVIGGNRITFRLTNGDTVTASFDTIVARLQDLEHWRTNPQGAERAIRDLQSDMAGVKSGVTSLNTEMGGKASTASLDALSGRVDGLSLGRGMVIDPYFWGAQSAANAEDWTGCEGEYWYNTENDYIYLCTGVVNGSPIWHQDYVAARCLVYNENNGELWLYQNLAANPSHIVIHQ